MLSLRQSQFDCLRQVTDRRFESRLLKLLAEQLSALGADNMGADSDELKVLMREGLALAGSLEIETDPEIAQVALLVVAARRAPVASRVLSPWASETLQRKESSPLMRLAWIRHQLRNEVEPGDGRNGLDSADARHAAAGLLATAMERLRGEF